MYKHAIITVLRKTGMFNNHSRQRTDLHICVMNKFEEELDDGPNKTLFQKAVPPFNEK